MKYKADAIVLYTAIAVYMVVIAALFSGCGGDLRHIAGEERDDFDPGETGDDYVRIGSLMKPVDTEWRYRVSEGGEEYEIEVTVIAVTDDSYKLRERREGYPDVEHYFEFGPETDEFATISLYEVYTVDGERDTHRYSPPRVFLPGDGYLREGLWWGDESISKIEATTMGRSERFTREFEIPGAEYCVEMIELVKTPAGEFTVATLAESSDGFIVKRRFISNIGTVKTVTYDRDGSVTETRELIDYSYPDRD